MDHDEAIRLQATARYVLGEFPAWLRDEFEEPFADCPECMPDVGAAAVFIDNLRAVFTEDMNGNDQPK